MIRCEECDLEFLPVGNRKIYCSNACCNRSSSRRSYIRYNYGYDTLPIRNVKCGWCGSAFQTRTRAKNQCSDSCTRKLSKALGNSRDLLRKSKSSSYDPARSNRHRTRYTSEEIKVLRGSPLATLPNRSLRSQWDKCLELNIPRDKILHDAYWLKPEVKSRPKSKRNLAARRESWRKSSFRNRTRKNPGPALNQLRELAKGLRYAEDIIIEGFAILLRLAIPPQEAFKLAKAEVNRTTAQPFREQSFDPGINYEARETGRQVARASDIRAARGDGG